MKQLILASLLAVCLMGCNETGPQKALNQTASALGSHNAQAFLAQIDMEAYSDNYLRNLAGGGEAINSLNALGEMLGLGKLDQLIGSLGNLVDIKARLADRFTQGVATGEMMAQCRTSTTADCPWVPEGLRQAQVVELSPTAAIAKITTPQQLVCWLALRKTGQNWLIVGQALMENQARQMALGTAPGASQSQGQRL